MTMTCPCLEGASSQGGDRDSCWNEVSWNQRGIKGAKGHFCLGCWSWWMKNVRKSFQEEET